MKKQTEIATIGITTLTDDEAIAKSVTKTGLVVLDILKSLGAFFSNASLLERNAKKMLMAAKVTPNPTDAASDLAIQTNIKKANVAVNGITEYWQPITSGLHSLHKLMVACRSRGTDAAEEASKLWNAQHSLYVREAKEAAEAETRRLEAVELARAEAARQAELDAIEAEAVKSEESGEVLSAREQKFVDAYRMAKGAEYQRAAQASMIAGFRGEHSGARLIGLHKIREAIVHADLAASLRSQAAAQRNAPIITREVEQVQADVQKGGIDRATYTADVFDSAGLIQEQFERFAAHLGIVDGTAIAVALMALPIDLLQINQVVANGYARSLKEHVARLGRGIRAKRSERLV